MKGKTIDCLRRAVAAYGYDFDVVLAKESRGRIYSDLRAIVWYIYQQELCRTTGQLSRVFRRDRSLVSYSLRKARTLISSDKEFRNLYDTILSYYMVAKTFIDYDKGKTAQTDNSRTPETMGEETR